MSLLVSRIYPTPLKSGITLTQVPHIEGGGTTLIAQSVLSKQFFIHPVQNWHCGLSYYIFISSDLYSAHITRKKSVAHLTQQTIRIHKKLVFYKLTLPTFLIFH